MACVASPTGSHTTPQGKTRSFAAPAGLEADYRTHPPAGDALVGAGKDAIEQGLQQAAAETGRTLTGDPRLAALCAWVADHVETEGKTPPHAAVDLAAHHLGLFEPVPHLVVLGLPTDGELAARVHAEVVPMLSQHAYTHYGALDRARDGGRLVVIALSWRWFEADPVASRKKTGESVLLRGKLAAGYSLPELAVTAPDGRSSRRSLGDGPRFAIQVPFGATGTYRVELLAQSSLGSTVVANFPVYVSVEPPRVVHVTETPLASLDDAPGQFLDLINRDRAVLGLSALQLDGELGRVAAAHSADMRDHDFVGHSSPRTGSAAQRVERSGIRTGTVLENIGRGYSLQEVHDGLMASPGHRDNVLSPRVTHVGVGLVEDGDGENPAYLVTEVFVRRAPALDAGAAPATLLAAINDERKAAGLTPLQVDERLAGVAHEAAARYFAEPDLAQQRIVQDANARLGKMRLPFQKLASVMVVVDGLDQAATLKALQDAGARQVGIGVAQGNRADAVDDAIAVVLLLGY